MTVSSVYRTKPWANTMQKKQAIKSIKPIREAWLSLFQPDQERIARKLLKTPIQTQNDASIAPIMSRENAAVKYSCVGVMDSASITRGPRVRS